MYFCFKEYIFLFSFLHHPLTQTGDNKTFINKKSLPITKNYGAKITRLAKPCSEASQVSVANRRQREEKVQKFIITRRENVPFSEVNQHRKRVL